MADSAKPADTPAGPDSGSEKTAVFAAGHSRTNAAAEAAGVRDMAQLADSLIMMVDDEELNIEMTQAFLEDAGYRNFVSTHESEKAIDLLRARKPRVLLLDLTMPKVGGLDILGMMREDAALRRIPVIVLTSLTEPAVKLRALELGATDFLSKPVDPSELALRLRNTLVASAYREHLANHDQLTGLPNRARYLDAVEEGLAQSAALGTTGALLHIGVDRLAAINDAMGRAAGDILLQRIARRLRHCVETESGNELMGDDAVPPSVYRFDGDEFAVLLPDAGDMHLAAGFIMKLLDAAAMNFGRAAGREVHVTSSIGVTLFPEDGRDADTLMSNAGAAMRAAKQAGAHTYEFFSRDMGRKASQNLTIGGDLRKAVVGGELALRYQPKLDVATGALCGVEAVPLWTNSRGSRVGREVIALADTAEMAMVLSDWMLGQLKRDIGAWRKVGMKVPPVGFDVSMAHLPAAEFANLVRQAVRDGLPPSCICIELDGWPASGEAQAWSEFARLGQIGVRLALDNFGSGRLPLGHLEALQANEIKLDRTFMRDIRSTPRRAAVAMALLRMARELQTTLVAQGVPDPATLEFLKANGFDQYQDDFTGLPLAPLPFAQRWLAMAARPAAAPAGAR